MPAGREVVQLSTTYLALLDTDIRNGEGRATTQLDAGVTVTVDRRCHGNLDILKLCRLCNSPVERSEGIPWIEQR